jgi:peroxiredoxin
MTIKVGDKIISEPLMIPSKEKGVDSLNLEEFSKGKKIVVFAVPAAFSPTCSKSHLPGYIKNYELLREKGIDAIICISVNDIFVMKAWARDQNSNEKVILAADGSAKFTKGVGMDIDLDTFGQGIRSKRYSMLIEDSVVKSINVESKPGQAEDSGAEKMLKIIG